MRVVMADRQKPGPKPKPTSKRNDPEWKAATVFMTVPTKERLEKLLALAKVVGVNTPKDQSDAIEAALAMYLTKMEKQLFQKLGSRVSG